MSCGYTLHSKGIGQPKGTTKDGSNDIYVMLPNILIVTLLLLEMFVELLDVLLIVPKMLVVMLVQEVRPIGTTRYGGSSFSAG